MEKIRHPSDYNDVHVVAIWGMGGIGKTTLAQSIYNNERVQEVSRSWLCVGENKLSAEKVIREIVNDKKTIGIANLQTKLVEKLRRDRFLIVLDDVWDVDGSEWDLLYNPLTQVGKGGLIIITTRKTEVCTATNTQTTYDLKPLSEENSWSIFERCAYIDGKSDTTPELKRIGKQIVKKLNGLPFALKVVGSSLLYKDSSTWTSFLESKLTNDDEVMSALRWSYNHLPRHLKMCFTYCALFPKDHVFDNEKVLVEMWMAHGLIQKEERKRPEDVGAQYFQELVNASLLQCVGGKYVMHDLIHDLALHVSNGEFATGNGSLSIDQMKKVRHITITPGDYSNIPCLCKSEKLLTLYTICSGEEDTNSFDVSILDDIFKQLKSIRVLVLCGKGIKEIPVCISELKHLRYLDVSKTSVESLPDSLCHLYNLQMIAAPHIINIYNRVKLPIDIVNMVNLRYVRAHLSTCKGVGKLTSLQELSSIHVCEGDNIRELGDMQRLRGKLRIEGLENVTSKEDAAGALMGKQTRIDELELVFKRNFEKSIFSVLDALKCPPNLTYLAIFCYTDFKLPRWMVDRKLLGRLQTLELSDCPNLESLPPFGELTSLKHLSLKLLPKVERLGDEFYGNLTKSELFFPSLESLDFSHMNGWEKWDDINIKNSSVSFFPRLTSLKIDNCPKLVLVLPVVKKRKDKHPIMNAANFMTSLSSFMISNCDGLKRLQLDALVSLKELEISSCNRLETMNFEKLPSLEHLDVKCCDKLTSIPCLVGIRFLSLFGCENLRSLSIDIHKCLRPSGLDSLEHLVISKCPVLDLTIEKGSSSSASGNSHTAPQLQPLPPDFHKISSLESLKLNDCQRLESLPPDFHKLSSLKSLNITNCPQLKSLPPYFHMLLSLKSLEINNCQQLKLLPPSLGELYSLQNLEINVCPKLQSLPLNFHKLSSLNSLKIVDCPQLQSLPQNFHELLSLKSLEINDCQQLELLPPSLGELYSLQNLDINGCPKLQSLPLNFHKLSSLESLIINDCSQLQSLPLDFHELSSLEKLYIISCPKLQSLPADGLPSSLTYLGISGCPLVYEQCKDESGGDWHKINDIRQKNILP